MSFFGDWDADMWGKKSHGEMKRDIRNGTGTEINFE